jgi:hypothetical protein
VKLEEAKMKIEEAKVPVVTSDEAYELRAELKELKDLVLVDNDGVNGIGDKPTGPLSQTNWATLDRKSIPWAVINEFVEDDALVTAAKTSSEANNDKTSSKARLSSQGNRAKLAKLVEKAKTTDMWCLSRFVLTMQEAMAKQRKICPINPRGEVCTADNCGNKHPKVCNVAAHGKGKILKATCTLWHMQVSFAGTTTQGNFTGKRNDSNPHPGSKGNNNKGKPVRPAKPYMISKREREAKAKELRARIRTAKEQGRMILQGITYRQVAEGPVPPPQPPVHIAPCVHALQQSQPALPVVDAIAGIERVLNQLRNQ